MQDNIPVELVAALASDARMREQFTSMYLVQQEVLVAITAQLHQRGLLDADAVADHVLSSTSAPELGDLAPDLGRVFCQRLAERLAGQPPGGSGEPPR